MAASAWRDPRTVRYANGHGPDTREIQDDDRARVRRFLLPALVFAGIIATRPPDSGASTIIETESGQVVSTPGQRRLHTRRQRGFLGRALTTAIDPSLDRSSPSSPPPTTPEAPDHTESCPDPDSPAPRRVSHSQESTEAAQGAARRGRMPRLQPAIARETGGAISGTASSSFPAGTRSSHPTQARSNRSYPRPH